MRGWLTLKLYGPIVQRLEYPVVSRKIAGSNPVRLAIDSSSKYFCAVGAGSIGSNPVLLTIWGDSVMDSTP